jgi:hypothetical protein
VPLAPGFRVSFFCFFAVAIIIVLVAASAGEGRRKRRLALINETDSSPRSETARSCSII